MIAKFYIPILETLVAFTALYFLPEGFILIFKRFFNYSEYRLSKFIVDNLKGYFFGTAVAMTCFFAFGISPENFFAQTVRNTAESIRKAVGLDADSICIRRAKEEIRFTPDAFADEASKFNVLQDKSYDPRDVLLSMGNIAILFGNYGSSEEIYEAAYKEYCKIQLNPPNPWR